MRRWNNFNTNHFRNGLISGLFKAQSEPIRTYFLQRSSCHQNSAVDSFLLMLRTTPSKFVMRPPWDSERSVSSDFTSETEKSPPLWYSANRKAGGSSFHLRCYLKPRNEAAAQSGLSSFHKNRPLDDNTGLIGCNVARAFLAETVQAVLPPDFLNVGGNTNQENGSPFRNFGYFSSLTALTTKIVRMITRVLIPYLLLMNSFILADFLQPWKVCR